MSTELRFKEKMVNTNDPALTGEKNMVLRRILQVRYTGNNYHPGPWQDVPCVGVDDD